MVVVSAFRTESYLRQPAPICFFDFCNVIKDVNSAKISETFGTAAMRIRRIIINSFY